MQTTLGVHGVGIPLSLVVARGVKTVFDP